MSSWLQVFSVVSACGFAALACNACSSDKSSSSSGDASSGGSSGGSGTSGGTTDGSSGGGTSGGGTSGGTSGGVAGPGTTYAGCRIFPNDNAWNTTVDTLPVDTALTASVLPGMALGTGVHPDWGTVTDGYGIPITVGKASTPVPISWNTTYGPRESDKLPCPGGGGDFCYPIPLDARIEGGTGIKSTADRHVLFLANDGAPDHCALYELYNTQNPSGGGFTAASGAVWKLDSNAMRTEGWTSADAAGLAVLPGLVRLDEVKRGEITHAIRFTMDQSQQAYIHPATHAAGDANPSLPPMGLRMRLKASFNDAAFTGASKVVTTAMKKYGIILADNGSNWYISGESDNAWEPEMDALLSNLGKVKGSDFEIVKTGTLIPQAD